MKNILLLASSIIIALFLCEVVIRYSQSWVPVSICRAIEFSEQGYWLNPNHGIDYPQPQLKHIQYHFYPPHLRDTPFNPQAQSILVLGDSFTFGWLLKKDQTFLHHLQMKADHLWGKNKYQFLNAACGGWGASDYLSYLEEFGEEIKPTFVLIFLNTDDIGRSIIRDNYKLANFKSLTLINNHHPLPHIESKKALRSTFCWIIKRSQLLYFLYAQTQHIGAFLNSKNALTPTYQPQIPMSPDLLFEDRFAEYYGQALFHRMDNWCKQHHAKLLIVTTGFNVFYPAKVHDPTKVFLNTAGTFFSQQQIPYYDMGESFKQTTKEKNIQLPNDQHPNALGAAIIAEMSWPWIKQHIEAKAKGSSTKLA